MSLFDWPLQLFLAGWCRIDLWVRQASVTLFLNQWDASWQWAASRALAFMFSHCLVFICCPWQAQKELGENISEHPSGLFSRPAAFIWILSRPRIRAWTRRLFPAKPSCFLGCSPIWILPSSVFAHCYTPSYTCMHCTNTYRMCTGINIRFGNIWLSL